MMDHRSTIIALLEKIKERDFARNDKWKVKAYANVIDQLKMRQDPIYTLEDIKDIKGVGDKIRAKISEIISTGDLGQVHIKDDTVDMINDLARVFGIGPVRAAELHRKHGITKVEELSGHLDLLNEKQQMGLKYYLDFEKRIPRKEMVQHERVVRELIGTVSKDLSVQVMGSYRRGHKDSGDIDILITHADDPEDYSCVLEEVVDRLRKDNYITDVFSQGHKKMNGVCKLKRHKFFRRIDIMYTRRKEWPFALAYFTGDANFNILMRKLALDKGMSLNEYGLRYTHGTNKGALVDHDFMEEQDIFAYLGVAYVDPKDRNGRVQFAAVSESRDAI
jgi:DNA polymerase beta